MCVDCDIDLFKIYVHIVITLVLVDTCDEHLKIAVDRIAEWIDPDADLFGDCFGDASEFRRPTHDRELAHFGGCNFSVFIRRGDGRDVALARFEHAHDFATNS